MVTLDAMKTYLSIPLADTSKDTWVELLINAASDAIEKHCVRSFTQATYTHTLDGHQNNEVVLPQWPVTSVTDLRVDSDRVFGADTIKDAAEYTVIDGVLRLHTSRFPEGSQNVRITYTAGYATIPSDLQLACMFYVEWSFRTQNDRRLGRTTTTKGNETVEHVPGMPKEIREILEPWVNVSIPSTMLRAGVHG